MDKQQQDEARAVGVDVVSTGVPIDSEAADPAAAPTRRGVRAETDGREMYAWETKPKDHVGPAAGQLKAEAKKN